MTDRKMIAIFGAGSGLGASLAETFGRNGYCVALVARRTGPLKEQVVELGRSGIEAVAFSADLTDLDGIAPLVHAIKEWMGGIDVAIYAPYPSNAAFVPAVKLDAAKLREMADVFTFAPVELFHAALPGMLARGDGAVVVGAGLSAVLPMPGMSGIGPLMAAVRNYVLTLNAEVASTGVYAGTINIGALLDRSTGLRAAKDGGMPVEHLPVIDPDEIAQEIWALVTQRNRVEATMPPLPSAH